MLVFVSHATADAELVDAITLQMTALGIETYLAEHDQKAGDSLAAKVEQNIRRSDLVIAVLTSAGFESRYVSWELGVAHAAGRLVIPLVEVPLNGRDLGPLAGIEYIPFSRQSPHEALPVLTDRVFALQKAQGAEFNRQQQAQQDRAMLVAALAIAAILLFSASSSS
jgi:hypothetical protein